MKTYVHLVKLEQPQDGIDLYVLLYGLVKAWKSLLAGVLLGVLLAGGYLFWFDEPQYEAVASVYVSASDGMQVDAADMQLANFLAADYCEVFGARKVLEMAARKLGLPYSGQQLEKMIRISNPQGTRTLYIHAEGPEPGETAALANAVFEAGCSYIGERMQLPLPTLVHEADVAQEALASGRAKILIAGAAVGLALPCVWICVRHALEERRRTTDSGSPVNS